MPDRNPATPVGGSPPENYERYFVPAIGAPLVHDLLGIAALKPWEHVVDVGCGTGVVTRLAAEVVGPKGLVVGVDVEPGMIAVARSVTPPDTRIEWRVANAETLPFDDKSFDVALCQMSLQFADDRHKGLGEMHRVLKRGGRAVIGLPGPAAPMFETLADSMGRHIEPAAKGFVQRVFSLYAPDALEALLKEAGFKQVDVRSTSHDLSLPAPREFLWQYIGSTPLAGVMQGVGGAARQALEAEVVEAWNASASGDGMALEQPMVYVTASK